MKLTVSQPQNRIKTLRQLLSGKRNATRASIVNTITGLVAYSGSAFPSQEYLGNVAGVERETINRRMPDLDGKFFHKIYRHMDTCTYHPTSEFLNNRHHFYDLIPALRQISLLWIFSITSNIYSQNVTPYKEYYRKSDKRSSAWAMKRVENAPLGFYEPRSLQDQSNSIVFFKKRQQIAANTAMASKERVMEQTIAQLAAAFNLNNELAEQYVNQYSKSVLAKALQSFEQQRKVRKITNPKGWLAWVLADEQRKEQEKASRFPKNGKEAGHSTKPRNPNGHSPATELPNLTHVEQIEYLMNEILKFSKTFDPDKVYSPDAALNEYLKKIAMNSIASMQREVEQLLALLDDPNHNCSASCVDKSPFLRTFQVKDKAASTYSEGPDYEEHLDEISKDKLDPEEYKLVVRQYDYHRTARK